MSFLSVRGLWRYSGRRCIKRLIGQYKQPAVVIMIILNGCIIASLIAGQVRNNIVLADIVQI